MRSRELEPMQRRLIAAYQQGSATQQAAAVQAARMRCTQDQWDAMRVAVYRATQEELPPDVVDRHSGNGPRRAPGPLATERRPPVSVYLSAEELKAIDAARGAHSRSDYLRTAALAAAKGGRT